MGIQIIGYVAFIGTIISGLLVIIVPLVMIGKELKKEEKLRKNDRS